MSLTEKLIEFVKQYPILFDLSHKDYKNVRIKDKIWEEIGIQLKVNGTFSFIFLHEVYMEI